MDAWVEDEFASAQLGDKRLRERLKLIASRIFDNPQASIKSALRGWTEVIGAYRFFNNSEATIEAILAPHRDATLERVKEHNRVLIIQDTTELDYSSKSKLKGKGPLSTLSREGFFAHNHFVVTAEGLALGVWDTHIYARDPQQHGKATERKQKPIEEKESNRWLEGYAKACNLAQLAKDTEVISCSDREGDIYEVFEDWHQRSGRGEKVAQLLIRLRHDRRIVDDQQQQVRSKILTKLSSCPVLGTVSVDVKKKTQFKKDKKGNNHKQIRSARKAIVEIRATDVTLEAPARTDRKLSNISLHVVLAQEQTPPAGEEPICWVLLTTLKADDFQGNLEIVQLYAERWGIECFHRVLKTGFRVEELQFKNDESIKPAVALYMVIAWRVLYVMKLGRECPDLPCDVVFEEEEWKSACVIADEPQALKNKPSLGQFMLLVAKFGGYLGRKSDGPPGAQAIWQGMSRVTDFALTWKKLQESHLLAEPP
jgi:hypothetical protein